MSMNTDLSDLSTEQLLQIVEQCRKEIEGMRDDRNHRNWLAFFRSLEPRPETFPQGFPQGASQ